MPKRGFSNGVKVSLRSGRAELKGRSGRVHDRKILWTPSFNLLRCRGVCHHIADAADGADEPGVLRVVAEFAPEIGDMDIERAVERLPDAVADFLHQLVAGFHAALGPGEREQDLK